MKLPKLPDLDMDDVFDNDESTEEPKGKGVTKQGHGKKSSDKNEGAPKKPIIPKTEYDAEGNPILAIPDLDDVDLKSELDRFFGD